MLDLRLFQNPRFAVSSGGITLVFFAMFGSFFMLAQYFQGVIGWSPLGAAAAAAAVLGRDDGRRPEHAEAGRPLRRQQGRRARPQLGRHRADRHAAVLRRRHALLEMLIVIFFLAAGMAMTMTPMTTQLMAAVPRDRAGMGSATNDTTRELGGALGVAVLGSLVTSQFANGVAAGVAGLPAAVREEAEGGLGGVIGLNLQGLVPDSVVDTARAVPSSTASAWRPRCRPSSW